MVTENIKSGNEDNDRLDDWQFAAMCLDRFCLQAFSIWIGIKT